MTGTTLTGKQFFIGMAAIVATIGFSAKAETDILGKTPTYLSFGKPLRGMIVIFH